MSSDLPLGRQVEYPREYDANLLFPIPRANGRDEIGLAGAALPFHGHDRWHAYELGWLDLRGKPVVATATLTVPAASARLVESKSLKLYLNSFNASRFADPEEVRARIAADLSACAGAPVEVAFGLPDFDSDAAGTCIDGLDVAIDHYGPPDAGLLSADAGTCVEETLTSNLLKSNCPVTGQPDWGSLVVEYQGAALDPASLLAYVVSFRRHQDFHEQCVERIFLDLQRLLRPQRLTVYARYLRRGGLDINPYRSTEPVRARNLRLARQ